MSSDKTVQYMPYAFVKRLYAKNATVTTQMLMMKLTTAAKKQKQDRKFGFCSLYVFVQREFMSIFFS